MALDKDMDVIETHLPSTAHSRSYASCIRHPTLNKCTGMGRYSDVEAPELICLVNGKAITLHQDISTNILPLAAL